MATGGPGRTDASSRSRSLDAGTISTASTLAILTSVLVFGLDVGVWRARGIVAFLSASVALMGLLAPHLLGYLVCEACARLGLRLASRVSPKEPMTSIVAKLRMNPQDYSLQDSGLRILLTSLHAASESEVPTLLRSGLVEHIQALVEGQEREGGTPLYTLENALRLALEFFTHPKTRDFIAKHPGGFNSAVVQLLHRMLAHERGTESRKEEGTAETESPGTPAQIAEVQRLCLMAVGALCEGQPDTQTIAFDEGFAEAATEAIRWYRLFEPVCQWALWALFNASYDHNSNKLELYKAGGLKDIIDTMKRHPSSLQIQKQGVALLYNTLMANESMDIRCMRKAAASCGLQDVLNRALKEFPRDDLLQGMAKAIIQNGKDM